MNRKNVLNLLGAILGIGLLLVIAFALNSWFGAMRTAKESASASSRSQQVTPSQESKEQRSPTQTTPESPKQANLAAGGQLYTSASHGYSIKYPQDWSLKETPNVAFKSPDYKTTPGGTVVGGGSVVILVNNSPTNKPLSDLISDSFDFQIIEKKETTVSRPPALWYEARGAGIDNTMTGVAVAVGNKLYRIESYYAGKDKDRVVGILELMLRSMELPTK